MAEHPDEGTIHAWLDGELPAAEAERIAAHVAGCAACSATVAEARGLIAGASRVVRSLDPDTDFVRAGHALPVDTAGAGRAPRWGAAPADGAPGAAEVRPIARWTRLRVTPARAAIAATLIVAAGITMTRGWVARESELAYHERAPAEQPTSPSAGYPARHDTLLDSALARNIAQSVPTRTLQRAPGVSVPVEAPVAARPAVVDTSAPERVAEGRRALAMAKAAPGVAADNAAVGAAAPSVSSSVASVAPRAGAPTRRERPVQTVPVRKDVPLPIMSDVAAPAPAPAPAAMTFAGQCLRIESPTAGAQWGTARLPLTVTLEPGTGEVGEARILPVSGIKDSAMFATWRRQSSDSISLTLRRIGYSGSMQIAMGDAGQGGVMRSQVSASRLEEVVVTGVTEPTESRASGGATKKKAVRRAKPAVADEPTPAAGAAIGITARRVGCQ